MKLNFVPPTTAYGPSVAAGKYGEEQKLQTVFVEKLTLGLLKSQIVQVNGEILNADRFAQKFKAIPDVKTK